MQLAVRFASGLFDKSGKLKLKGVASPKSKPSPSSTLHDMYHADVLIDRIERPLMSHMHV